MTDAIATSPVNDPVNDNEPRLVLEPELAAALGDSRVENVVGAAILVATAFRLRDEDALILTLRRLTTAVDALENAETQAEPRAACG